MYDGELELEEALLDKEERMTDLLKLVYQRQMGVANSLLALTEAMRVFINDIPEEDHSKYATGIQGVTDALVALNDYNRSTEGLIQSRIMVHTRGHMDA